MFHQITQTAQDYLKAIFKLERQYPRVTTSAIAEWMGVSPAAVTSMVKKLDELQLLRRTPYQGVELTEAGRRVALETIRHHRLLEVFMVRILGFGWDEVNDEAERLEHFISENFEDHIDRVLDYPKYCPHGDPIPTKEGHLAEAISTPLSALPPGGCAVVRRIGNTDAEVLRYLASLDLQPGKAIELIELGPFRGPVVIRVDGRSHAIGRDLADTIYVSLEGSD